jgi:hypothetical protein
MPTIQPDTSEAQEMAPIQPGTYAARIAEVDVKTSKQGNPMIVPKFKVNVDGKERTRQAYLVITGEGAYGFDQLLRATGFANLADQYRDPRQPNPEFDTDQLIGQELMVVVEPDVYQGQKRDKIQSYLPK